MAPKRETPPPRRVLEGVLVLVVEDHPASGRMVAAVLSAAGADVKVVDTAEAAMPVLATFRPHALVVDVVLPGASGHALVQLIKAQPTMRGIVCIAVSVLNGDDARREALRMGCAEYVKKPIDTDTFAALIAGHLGGKP